MGKRRNYSPKVLGYIEKHCGEGSLDWMRGELAERFGIECTREKIRYYRRNQGITSGVDTRFIKGQPSHNKGQAAPLHVRKAMEPTMFRKGNRPHNTQPVGTRVKTTDGYWKIKIAEPNKWQLLSRYEWERIHGEKLKASELVLFLDHNPDNLAPDNLVKLTRAELARLNQDNLRGADKDLNMAAVNLARLKTRAKDAEAKRKKGRRPDERPDDIHNDNGGAVHPPGGSRKEREGGRGISQGKDQGEGSHKGRKAEIHQREDQGTQ